MKTIEIQIELLSDTLSGSGEGFGAIIDSDVEHDEYGIPYISAKRIKGCLKNSLSDLLDMPAVAKNLKTNKEEILRKLFGNRGEATSSLLSLNDFYIPEYNSAKEWFKYLIKKHNNHFSKEAILASFTNIRQQTQIEDGVAKEHSLRTSRVVNKGMIFKSTAVFEKEDPESEQWLALACANLRKIGTKRSRGLGEIRCTMDEKILNSAITNLQKMMGGK